MPDIIPTASPRRPDTPLFDASFFAGAMIRRAGISRTSATRLGTTINEKISAELGWAVTDALLSVSTATPAKSAAFISCFTRDPSGKSQSLDATMEKLRETLLYCIKGMRQCTGSTAAIPATATTAEICSAASNLIDLVKERALALSDLKDKEDDLATLAAVMTSSTTVTNEDVEKAMGFVKEREAFLEESEQRLMRQAQLQQERETELEQLKEDLEVRERRLNGGAQTILAAAKKHDEFNE